MKDMIRSNYRVPLALLATFALLAYSLFDAASAAMLATAAAVTIDDLPKLAGEFKQKADALTALGDELKSKQEAGEKGLGKLKDTVDEKLTELNEFKSTLKELQQKFDGMESANAGDKGEKSFGEQVINSPAFKSFVENGDASVRLQLQKDITTTSAGPLVGVRREADPIAMPRQRLLIRDLLPVVPTTDGSIEYAKQTLRTNAARPVAEGTTKPYSDYAWEPATVPVRTIAHLAKLTRQAYEDAPRLMAEVNVEMRYGLGLVEEAQILNGDNTGQNLHGLLPQARAYAAPVGVTIPNLQRVDVLRLAMLQTVQRLFAADGMVLSDLDWTLIELLKADPDGGGGYLFSNPQGVASQRLWGISVVATPAMPNDNFLVGNFAMGATLYDRMGVEVLLSTENADDFEKNLATMRAEERIALAVKRPDAFVTGTFTDATTP